MNITTFNSFKSRNYRLFFAGQSVSLIGTWMQKTAVSWIIYSITGSKFMLGVSVFATLFPTAIFSLYGGIIADRYNRYRVLLITQVISLLQAVLLTLAIIFFRQDAVWWIIGLSVMLGIVNGFDVPARQSLVRDMVDKDEDLPNALALNSSMVNLSKLIGPALAGFILESFGEQVCFGINAVSFIAVIVSLLFMHLDKSRTKPGIKRDLRKEFSEAYQYIKNTATISSVIVFAAMINLFALPFSTLTPVFAKDIFKGNASTFGVIDGFVGLGAFIGALYLASLKKDTDLSKILARSTFIFGTGLMLFSYTTFFPLALAFLIFTSFGMMAIVTLTNTIIQLIVPHELRGRIISVFVMVLTAMVPIGSLLVGSISHYIGVENTVLGEGIIAIIVAFFYNSYLKKQKLKAQQIPVTPNAKEAAFTPV
ncbi:MFS family permease [Pedobacter sp. UYP30]|uniref:MFS transporter n=1 Tax=Pedobacter sp. UYP30 TaxID=1756400 RepID=UPI00339164CC